jgi:sortase A
MAGKHAAPKPGWRARRRQPGEAQPHGHDAFELPAAPADEREHTAIFDREALDAMLHAEAPVARRRRRLLIGATAAVAALGMATSGVIGWTMYRPAFDPTTSDRATAQIREAWESGSSHAGYIGLIRIPRFGKTWEFSVSRGTNAEVLKNGAGWYENGAEPGEVGNVVVSAHRVTNNAPFHEFPTLRPGDLVQIETRFSVFTYRMMDSGNAITVPDTTLWPLWDVPDPKARAKRPTERMLTLITCARLFHTDKRLVARGHLVDTERKGRTA